MKYKILPAAAFLSTIGCGYMPVSINIQNLHMPNSETAKPAELMCPAPQITKSFLPNYGIENLVAELENPLNINMDVRSETLRLDYVVCAYNSKSMNSRPVKIKPDQEKIRFLTGREYDMLAIYVKNESNLEPEATIYRQTEGGREVTYIKFDSKYIGNISGKSGNFILRLNYWRFSLINRIMSMILHKRAEKNGLLKPPDSEDDSKIKKGQNLISISD